jgi:poly-gamma-glutamate synthesis protein (capsule biosynthesis protein)
MVYTQSYSQPSILELARAGNFQAIGYWINRELTPQGIYARVQHGRAGYLQIFVEFQQEPPADRLIKFICHQLAKLNSPTFIGVRIVARFAGSPEILWQRTVRLVRPKRKQRKSRITWPSNWEIDTEALNFQTLRSLLLMGSTVASFILGCWVSYHEVLVRRGAYSSETIQTALEKVEVVHHNQVVNPAEPTVTLMFAGDVNLSDSFTEVVGQNYSQVFAKMNEYREADLAMINLENAFTRAPEVGADKQQLKHKAAPEYVKVLTEGGVDLVNLANDRIMDYEEEGLADTIETLAKAGIHHLGAGMDLKEARRPQIIEVKGKLIAYLGYYDADLRAAKEGQAGINASYNDRIAADIAVLRDKVDWIIVNYHWGVELSDYPGDWQIDLARFTIDRGADLVVGHHPRVLQGAEIYKGRPIIYSLGNFIFGGNSASDYETAVLRVSLKENKMKAEFLPVVVQNYQPQIVAGEKGEEILRHIGHLSSIFEQPMSSPMVLELEGSDSKTSQNSQPSLPNLPSISATEEPEKPTPGRLMGGRDVEDQRKQNLPVSHTIIESEKSKVGGETVMPPLLKQAETGETSENDPFIKEPFIKDPFIETPTMEIQSKRPAESNLKTANSKGSDRVIYLPSWIT